jgi:ABC-type lipoprotein release transport system permease subunit
MGIRVALGAERSDVFLLVVRDGMLLVAIGLVVGVAAALAGTRWLASFLYGISPSDLPTFAATTAILTMVSLAACAIPAARAMRVPPIAALRYE